MRRSAGEQPTAVPRQMHWSRRGLLAVHAATSVRALVVQFAALAMGLISTPAPAAMFSLAPGQTAVGVVDYYLTHDVDTLLDVARHYDLGYTQLIAANRAIDPWLPGENRKVVIPNFYLLPDVPHQGIVINLAQQRLFYFPPGGHFVEIFPIGVGVQGWVTPLGDTRVTEKQVHPSWFPPPSILAEEPGLPKMIPPGPGNPLGDYALQLGWPSYLIHGTDKPFGVGRNVSHGCIRLYPEDIEKLFREVAVGTPVRVIAEEVTAAWIGDDLYVSVFPNKSQTDELDIGEPMTPETPPDLTSGVLKAAGIRTDRIDWNAVAAAGRERSGVPSIVSVPATALGQVTR